MKKILVVDDEPDILTVVKLILTSGGFTVAAISDWEQVPDIIDSFKPNLILLDVSLSGADGREICTELKSKDETRDIPVILFSAHHNLIHSLRDCRADAVIAKPFDREELLASVTRMLN